MWPSKCVALALVMGMLVGTCLPVDSSEDEPQLPEGRCTQPFELAINQGPSAGLVLKGILALQVEKNGRIDQGVFAVQDGSTLNVVGQAHGRGLHLLFDRGDGQLIFGVGTGQQVIRECTGPVGGPAVGPLPGDSGEWAVKPVIDLACAACLGVCGGILITSVYFGGACLITCASGPCRDF